MRGGGGSGGGGVRVRVRVRRREFLAIIGTFEIEMAACNAKCSRRSSD